jgi:hypothetical protein
MRKKPDWPSPGTLVTPTCAGLADACRRKAANLASVSGLIVITPISGGGLRITRQVDPPTATWAFAPMMRATSPSEISRQGWAVDALVLAAPETIRVQSTARQ